MIWACQLSWFQGAICLSFCKCLFLSLLFIFSQCYHSVHLLLVSLLILSYDHFFIVFYENDSPCSFQFMVMLIVGLTPQNVVLILLSCCLFLPDCTHLLLLVTSQSLIVFKNVFCFFFFHFFFLLLKSYCRISTGYKLRVLLRHHYKTFFFGCFLVV